MMISRILIAALYLCSISLVGSSSPCSICEDGVSGIHWLFHNTDSQGTTCLGRAIKMARLPANSLECDYNIYLYRDMCCGIERPTPIPQDPDDIPSYDGPTGTFKSCDVCRDGDYPGDTGMVIHLLHVGPGSCKQYYFAGRAGMIPDHLCLPLQYFAYEPCGCGEHNQRLHSPAPTAHPNHPNYPKIAPPSACPSSEPSAPVPSAVPSKLPSSEPSAPVPSAVPSKLPSSVPSGLPTKSPSSVPSSLPTKAPTTPVPTTKPPTPPPTTTPIRATPMPTPKPSTASPTTGRPTLSPFYRNQQLKKQMNQRRNGMMTSQAMQMLRGGNRPSW